ncbi:MAG: ABC transporter permease [Clostridia bacterium]|nr:ABC transporter permease [Clostridia bacterium]
MKENIVLSFQSVWAHKLRSFLTMLGIIIGIASIITIVSAIKGTNEQIKENLIGAGNNAVVVQLYQEEYPMEFSYSEPPAGVRAVDEVTRNTLEQIDGADKASVFRTRGYSEGVFYQNTAFNGSISGIDTHYFDLYDYHILYGKSFTQEDFDSAGKFAVLDTRAASTIFGGKNPIGCVIEIAKEPFTVIGVVEPSNKFEPTINNLNDYYMYADTSAGHIFITDSAWQIVYGFDEPQCVAIRAKTTDDMTRVSQKAGEILTERLIDPFAQENMMLSYRGRDLLEDAQQLQQITTSTSRQLVWIASISLLVGGIGVMNIMLVSVTERTREIGLKKAIGARRRRILGQFLTEAAVLTSIGGILGVAAGLLLAKLISKFMGTPSAISVPAILLATLFSVVIGLVFGLLPAVKASKLNPIDALRRE